MRRAFDLDNGIYSEQVDEREPFSLIAMHKTEAAANAGKWEELLQRYHVHQIKDYFNFNFTEWVSQPNDIVEKQINATIRWRDKEVGTADAQTKALEAQVNLITQPNGK